MRLVLGIDGGQTATTAVIADETGRLLGMGHGGPANHIHEPGGIDRVRRSLTDAISSARAAAGVSDVPFAAAYLGMTGGSPEMEAICRPVVPAERMTLGHDSVIALTSVTFGRPGAVVIAGTGSVAYGVNPAGETALVGGWGYLMGDEGSGYWIGLRVLESVTRAADGRSTPTLLTERVLENFGVDSLKTLHRQVYSGALGRPEIAALSAVADGCAREGDRRSRLILQAAGRELGHLGAACLRRLEWTASPATVGCFGGVFASAHVRRSFNHQIRRANSQAQTVTPAIPAAAAAALLALGEHGIPADEAVVGRMRASLPAGSAQALSGGGTED